MGKTLADGYLELRVDPSKLDADTKKAFKSIGFKQKGQAAGKEAGEGLATGLKEKIHSGLGAALGAIGIGVGIGAGITSGLKQALDVGAANDKLRAQLNLNAAESAKLGKAAGQLYAKGYGDSMEQVNDALKSVIQNVPSLRNASVPVLNDIAAGALNISRVFDQDVGGVTAAISSMLKSGLAPNAKVALDTLTKGFQTGADKGQDLLDTFTEYSTQFKKLGLDGPTSLGIINQLLAGGARNADVAADAVKEFSIRAIDGSKSTVKGYELLGLNADKTAGKIAKGGPAAKATFDLIVDKLNAMKDPVARNAAGVDLFGTKWEDLGDSFRKLDVSKATSQLGQVAGATKGLATQSDSSRISGFLRGLQVGFVSIIGGQVIPAIHNFATANREQLAGALSAAAGFARGKLLPALKQLADFLTGTIIPAVSSVVGWLSRHDSAVKDAAIAAGILFGVYKAGTAIIAVQAAGGILKYLQATKLVTAATKIWAGIQAVLNLVLEANPIGLIVVGIAALVAGIIIAYKHSATFRAIVQGAWSGIKSAVAATVGFITGTVWPALKAAWNGIAAGALWLWHNVFEPVWHGIMAVVNVVVDAVKLYIRALTAEFKIVASIATWLYRNIFSPIFAAIGKVVEIWWLAMEIIFKAFYLVIKTVVVAAINVVRDVFTAVFGFIDRNVVQPWWAAVKVVFAAFRAYVVGPLVAALIATKNFFVAVFDAVASAVSGWWNGHVKPVFAAVKAGWDALSAGFSFIYENKIKPVFNAFVGFIKDKVVGGFKVGVEAIKAAWEKVQEYASKPVTFVVKKIINPFIGGLNKAASIVGIKDSVEPIKGFARGGQIPGYATGGRIAGAPSAVDNRLAPATIPGVGAVKLAGGEYIVNAADTAKALPLLHWVNNGMKGGARKIASYLGRPVADMPGDGSEGWAFKDGGLVGWATNVWDSLSHPEQSIKKPFEDLLRQIPGSGMIKDFLTGAGKKLLDGATNWLNTFGNLTTSVNSTGAVGAAGVAAAQGFLRHADGKPYGWANAGPNSWDCSGIVSSVWDILHGQNPYQHTFSTESAGNFFTKPGFGGPLTAAWSHPGQAPAGASVGHMMGNVGGLTFESTGSRGVHLGASTRRLTDFANIGHYATGGRIPTFDRGGTLMPGLNTVYNGLGRPEALVRADLGGDVHIHFHDSVIASKSHAEDLVVQGYLAAKKRKRL